MDNKCLCNCRCNKPWKVLKVYDHIKEADEQLRLLEASIKQQKAYPDAPWYSARPFEQARDETKRVLYHFKEIRDKYAKDLGMEDDGE